MMSERGVIYPGIARDWAGSGGFNGAPSNCGSGGKFADWVARVFKKCDRDEAAEQNAMRLRSEPALGRDGDGGRGARGSRGGGGAATRQCQEGSASLVLEGRATRRKGRLESSKEGLAQCERW
jgi:hypothetical protein